MLKRLLTSLCELDHLVRFHQLGFVAVWPLLGLVSVDAWSLNEVAGLLVIALCFNTYGVLLDDAVHLEVDRRDPLRADRWLVRGVVSAHQALTIAFLQLPVMLAVHLAAGFSTRSLLSLLGVLVGQGLYDLYGKRCRLPPLMEAAEAAAAFLLVTYGAMVTGREPTLLVWLTAGAGAAFILLVNGFHGSLRDIEVELPLGQRTTPIWLGCRGVHDGRVHISAAMSGYAGACQASLIGFSMAAAILVGAREGRSVGVIATLVACVAHAILFVLLHRLRKPVWDAVMRIHVAVLVLPILLAFMPLVGPARSAVLALVYFAPALLTAAWWFGRIRHRAADAEAVSRTALGARSSR